MTCLKCGCRMNPHSGLCQNKNCTRSQHGWEQREKRQRELCADSPDFIEQTPSLFEFAGAPAMTRVESILTAPNLQDTVWGKRIIAAADAGRFAEGDTALAASWFTCACGEVDASIPRNSVTGQPHDGQLAIFGLAFHSAVRGNAFIEAAKTLCEIERRAAEILGGLA